MAFIERKFAHQHPTFGRSKLNKAAEPFKNSVYYLWWEFLRRNEDYRKCCELGGKGKLSKLYVDFGDIYATDFKTWWQTDDRGKELFAEARGLNFTLIKSASELNLLEGVLTVQVPMYLPKEYLRKKFKALMDAHHKGRRGIRTNKNSTARYPVTGHVDVHALQKCLRAWDVKANDPNLKLWQVAQKAMLTRSKDRMIIGPKGDPNATAKKAVLTAEASRMLKKAKRIIAGVAQGKFPMLV
jgi:hypothetical protein